MNKNIAYLLLNIFLATFVLPEKAFAKCDFRTSEYIELLKSPRSITKIEVETPQIRKFTKNFIQSLVSKSKRIPKSFREKFNANINVVYPFGNCLYKGKIWQNGDYKDHLDFKKGRALRSLNVKLDNGNIMNSVKFKLLLPKSRNSLNEVLGSLIFKNLDYISPETFQVNVSLNGVESAFLFQEDSQKELLQRNSRREGPIFEGDETLIFPSDFDNNSKSGKLKDVSLARLINYKWFLKGKSSQSISLSAFSKLQHSYLYHSYLADKDKSMGFYIAPNNEKSNIFPDYHFLMISMSGHHGLAGHNRKFYYNSFTSNFEPIYYDGNLDLQRSLYWEKDYIETWLAKLKFNKDYKFLIIDKFSNEYFIDKLNVEFRERVLNYGKHEIDFFNKSILNLRNNISLVQDRLSNSNNNYSHDFSSGNYRIWYLKRKEELNHNEKIINKITFLEDNISLDINGESSILVNIDKLARILSRKQSKGSLYTYLPIKNYSNINFLRRRLLDINSHIITSPQTKIDINKIEKKIVITQSKKDDWALFLGGDFIDWNIEFISSIKPSYFERSSQRFNEYGLTGCLTFYESNFDNVTLNIDGSLCEDSINIVNSIGSIKELNVSNAYQDGVDIDSSDLKIYKISVDSAGNDCLDIGLGKLILNNGLFENCSDKAISTGEKSELVGKEIYINSSNIGLSVKDLSTLFIDNVKIKDTEICLEVRQKKQEFGGASAHIDDITCDGKYFNDHNSVFYLSNK